MDSGQTCLLPRRHWGYGIGGMGRGLLQYLGSLAKNCWEALLSCLIGFGAEVNIDSSLQLSRDLVPELQLPNGLAANETFDVGDAERRQEVAYVPSLHGQGAPQTLEIMGTATKSNPYLTALAVLLEEIGGRGS